ncbi:hypothetical protein KC19_1G296700 [Ceratodon purpureus]|uniref:Uncharacterized protein n=1 Tax=Ceratodon purpureus TaxID=3225 RepID=A0A8T0JCE9_CERPU|nr:hypothetical protein KC19_1G296700 [Ceratodon purpureus]
MRLAPLTALRKLILLGNQQSELKIPEGSFQELEVLDVSYNLLDDTAVIALSSLPSLRKLNMNNNNLELIPPEATETGAFVRLETLCVAGNSLSSTSLLSLSKLPWLETLHLHKNHIDGIPVQIVSMARAFSRLETLDLAENPINYHHNLIALEKLQKLRKVQLTITFDYTIKPLCNC